MRFLLSIIGYTSFATVLTVSAWLLYLWRTDGLNDEKMFRIMALVHDVDVEQIAAERDDDRKKVPPEEMSWEEVGWRQDLMQLNHEVRINALRRGREEFDRTLRRLSEQSERFDRLAKDLEVRLKQQGELTTKENVQKVVRDLELLKPDRAKEMLMRWVDEGRLDDVIMLMNSMSTSKLKAILQRFDEQDETRLQQLHRLMLEGGPQKRILDQALEQLKTLGADDT